MKDLAIVITISYFALYGAMSIVNDPKPVEAQVVNTDVCGLEDVFCYGDPIATMPVEGSVRLVEQSTDRKQTLRTICEDKGFKDDFCEKDLWGIAMTESRGNCDVIGDQGRSVGCFQIQTKMHGITVEQAKDFGFAAEWTLKRMQRFGYPLMRSLAIRRHNGFGQSTFAYLEVVNSYAK